MFVMTHEIILNENLPKERFRFKASSITWNRSIYSMSDTAIIKIPLAGLLHSNLSNQEGTPLSIKEGIMVTIRTGYDGKNETNFKGFIRRINYSTPAEIECEGYSYQLKAKRINKSYSKTTVKEILADIVKDTEIKLSELIPEVRIDSIRILNKSGLQALEQLKEQTALTIYFNLNELYCGPEQLDLKVNKKFRIGWNVVNSKDLRFLSERENDELRIITKSSREKDGTKVIGFSGTKNANSIVIKSVIKDKDILDQISKRRRKEILNEGYEGSFTAFLQPYVEPGMSVSIEDGMYPDRKGNYFVIGTSGEFGPNGGRQKIRIGGQL